MQRKIVSVEQLAPMLEAQRRAGRLIVQCHGCFDVVHPGHIRYLQFARQLGHLLVVSLTGDAAVAKGPDRPYIPQDLRAENLAALEFVDWVVIDPHPTACEILTALRPDVYVKGREYAAATDPRFTREREIVEASGGRVIFHSGDVVFSSTRLIQDLSRDRGLDACRLRNLCRRSGIDVHGLRALLDHISGLPALVVGDVIHERYLLCDPDEAADEAPMQSLRGIGERLYWGAAAAVARQLRALGARPVLVAAVADDAPSQALREALAAEGIESVLLAARAETAERCTLVADDAKLVQIHRGASLPPDSDWEKRAVREVGGRLADSRLLVWSDAGMGTVTPALRRAAAGRRTLTVAAHAPAPRGEIGRPVEADLLLTSERRLRRAMQDRTSSLPAVACALLRQSRSHAAIVSLHKRGWISFEQPGAEETGQRPVPQGGVRPVPRAVASDLCVRRRTGETQSDEGRVQNDRLRSDFIPAVATSFVDFLGVEESAVALSAAALAAGASLATATYLAAVAEALTVERPGLAPVSLHELHAWIDGRAELRPESRFLPDASTCADLARIAPPLEEVGASQ